MRETFMWIQYGYTTILPTSRSGIRNRIHIFFFKKKPILKLGGALGVSPRDLQPRGLIYNIIVLLHIPPNIFVNVYKPRAIHIGISTHEPLTSCKPHKIGFNKPFNIYIYYI